MWKFEVALFIGLLAKWNLLVRFFGQCLLVKDRQPLS
jgi:hypothetical protein